MDGYIRVLFIDNDTDYGKLVKQVTGGQWSHVGVLALNGLVEADPPRVTISSAHRYNDRPTEEVHFYVPDLEDAMTELKSLVGKPYGYLSAVSGGLWDIAGLAVVLDGEGAIDCSEVVVRTIRAGGGVLMQELPADCFTPQGLYSAIKIQVA